jgi:hypothetical protein
VTPIRPGAYEITNSLDGATGRLRVLYPNRHERRDLTLPAARISCEAGTFTPDGVEVLPAQGLFFQLHARARISIKLVEPDDGPRRTSSDSQGGQVIFEAKPL